MATVMIRLKRLGTKQKPHNRIVVIARQSARDGRAIEEVGYYDPSKNPPLVSMKVDRIRYWISQGAAPSPTVKTLFKRYVAPPPVRPPKADSAGRPSGPGTGGGVAASNQP